MRRRAISAPRQIAVPTHIGKPFAMAAHWRSRSRGCLTV